MNKSTRFYLVSLSHVFKLARCHVSFFCIIRLFVFFGLCTLYLFLASLSTLHGVSFAIQLSSIYFTFCVAFNLLNMWRFYFALVLFSCISTRLLHFPRVFDYYFHISILFWYSFPACVSFSYFISLDQFEILGFAPIFTKKGWHDEKISRMLIISGKRWPHVSISTTRAINAIFTLLLT